MRRRILLADDSVTIQKVIELTFLDEDYEVKAVSNGDEAIAALPQVNPDFVIADVHMPGANGYEVCRRSKELRPHIPVLLLVGTFEPFDEGQSRAVGADSFLKKPFDSQELLQRVEDLLAARQPAAVPEGSDLLGMPSLSELPPLDLEPAPAGPAAPEVYAAPAPEWGGFQVEPAPVPVSDPFPEPVPFRLEEDRPAFILEDDRPFAPSGESSFDEPPFHLDEEPLPVSAPVADESALLPAGEPLFELEPAPSYETPSFEEPYPSFETPSYEPAPAFDPPFEAPFEAFPEETPFTRAETVSVQTETFQMPGLAFLPEERLGVPEDAVPLVDSLAETEARIEAPPPPSFEASHEPSSSAAFAPFPEPTEAPVTEAPVVEIPAAAIPAAVEVPASSNGAGRLSDEDVDRIARRVVELLGDRTVRDVAWEVIPDMAEMVIRDRLRELESQAESFE